MSPADIALLTATLVNFVLFIIVFFHGQRRFIELFFAFFAASVGFWSIATFLSTSAVVPFPIFKAGMVAHYITGNLVFLFLFWFSIYFPFPNKRKWFPILVTFADCVILALVVLTPFLFLGFTDTPLLASKTSFGTYGYIAISFITVFMFIFSQVNLLRKRKGLDTLNRARINYVVLGTLTTGSIGLITNLLLPAFGNFSLFFIGPIVTTPFFVGGMIFTIFQYKLFNLRVITTEVFATLFIVVIALNFFNTTTRAGIVIQAFALVVALVFGYFLIRSVYQEVRDKEHIQQLADQLKNANDKLKELDKMKSQFLSIASHDLRAPITAIRNFMSLLLDGTYGKLPPAAEEGMHQVFDRATDMAHMVENYLNVSRIEQGRLKYDFTSAELLPLLQNAVNAFKPNAEHKGLQFSATFAPALKGKEARLDVTKINEILNNLIDNSIKYTPKGSVAFSAELQGGKVRITIKDTGVGMSEATIGKLFKLFSTADDSRKVNASSTGLGLYISKAHAEAHGGKLWAESSGEGKGSAFILELPLIQPRRS